MLKFSRQSPAAACLFLALSSVFVLHSAQFFDFVPFWDGWEFFRKCYQGMAHGRTCQCFGHSAVLNSIIFATALLPASNSVWPVFVMGLVVGLIGLVTFYALLSHFTASRLTTVERVLITFLFGLNPVFHVQVIQPSLDFALPVHLCIFLLMLLKQRYQLATIAGMFLVLTKEPGLMLYGLTVGLYGLMTWIEFDPIKRRPRLKIPPEAWRLVAPVLIFFVHVLVRPPQENAGASWAEVVAKLFTIDMSSSIAQGQLASLFVLNFSWLFLIVIVLAVAASWLSPTTSVGEPERAREWTLVYLILGIGTFLMTRVVFANNPRYMLPFLPLLILVFAGAFARLRIPRLARLAILSVMLMLIHTSSYRTIDPVSKLVFGTFQFGEHSILSVAPPEQASEVGYGRDQLLYNSQMTALHYLTEDVVQKFGLGATYVMDSRMCWTYESSFSIFDSRTGRRTVNNRHAVAVDFRSIDSLKEHPATGRIYFIDYPQMPSENSVASLQSDYDVEQTYIQEYKGYHLRVIQLRRRDRSLLSFRGN